MPTITIKNGKNLSRTEFNDWEDLQHELILAKQDFRLSTKHIELLKSREEEVDKNPENGLTWDEVKNNLTRLYE